MDYHPQHRYIYIYTDCEGIFACWSLRSSASSSSSWWVCASDRRPSGGCPSSAPFSGHGFLLLGMEADLQFKKGCILRSPFGQDATAAVATMAILCNNTCSNFNINSLNQQQTPKNGDSSSIICQSCPAREVPGCLFGYPD